MSLTNQICKFYPNCFNESKCPFIHSDGDAASGTIGPGAMTRKIYLLN